jgi:hypothetical protein
MASAPRSVLKNAMPFDWLRKSDAPEVTRAVRAVTDHIRPFAYQRSPRSLGDIWRHVEPVVLNLFLAFFHDPERWVFYPRNSAFIDGSTPLSAEILRRVVAGLEGAQLIENVIGERGAGLFDPETRRPLRSRMRATPKLYAMLQEHGVRVRMIGTSRDLELVQLKDCDKNRIELPNDRKSQRQIKTMEENLERINGVIAESFIGLHVPDARLREINTRLTNDKDRFALNFANKSLYRVFNNGSLERGGRFTGAWWQDVPSAARAHIYIGGPSSPYPRFSAEVDFSSMFPSIAYGLLGKELDDCAYCLGGVKQPDPIRKVVKRVLLTMLMEDGPNDTRKAVHKKLSDEEIKNNPLYSDVKRWRKRNPNGKFMLPLRECIPAGCPPLPEIIKAMEKQHEPLMKDFIYNPDRGLYLMHLESKIAERVMLNMADKDVPVLPIHDSFVVVTSCAGYAEEDGAGTIEAGELDTIMRESFRAEIGTECRVTFDQREPQKTTDTTRQRDRADWDKQNEPFTGERREQHSTYCRHYDDWYEQQQIEQHEEEQQRPLWRTTEERHNGVLCQPSNPLQRT